MTRIRNRITAFICALFMMISGSSDLFGTAVLAQVRTVELSASDGKTYRVTVRYDGSSDIPDDAELVVREITELDDAAFYAAGISVVAADFAREKLYYGEYLETAGKLLGGKGGVKFAKFLDISLRDPENGAEYKPGGKVSVSIKLSDAAIDDETDVGVVHFGKKTEIMDTSVSGDTVSFETDGFSVYAIIGQDAVPRRTYRFYVPYEDGYIDYALTTDHGSTTFTQIIRNGERPIVPQLSSDADGKTFAGWYEGIISDGNLTLMGEPYDFDNIPEITQNEKVDLYARFEDYAYVVFHDQYDSGSGTFPIAFIRRGALSGDPEHRKVNISSLNVTFNNAGGEKMAFYGWSYTPVSVPGSATDDNGAPVSKIDADDVTVSATTHLYPLFKSISWLSYYSGNAHSGANYVPPMYYFSGEGPDQLPVPTRDGYTFRGWYTGSLSVTVEAGETVETVGYGVRMTYNDGSLIPAQDDGGVYVQNGMLLLREDTMLYASWEENTEAPYRIVIMTQKPTDAQGLAPGERRYDYAESFTLSGTIGDSVSVTDEYKTKSYPGYVYSRCDGAAVVTASGTCVLRVYYDIASFPYSGSGVSHTLCFTDSETDHPSDDLSGTEFEAVGGADITGYVPDDPAPGRKGYEFAGWFFDKDCVIPAVIDEMPDRNMTVYAGWRSVKYQVMIDPNYGSLNGTGATWFSNRVDEDPIQEYIQVTRDYVESSSGTWYYVKHDLDYYGGNPPSGANRDAYYTQDPGEATEFKTFEYAPDYYRYAGWYEVHEDGSETPYDFTSHTDHDTTIRLHWKKVGVYYLEYNTVVTSGNKTLSGTLDTGNSSEALFASLGSSEYADNADVAVVRSAVAPDGYRFAGWKVRGDDSGNVYAPGHLFTLMAEYAVSENGRNVVILDAVYLRVETAKIIYDANGGTVDGTVDYGSPVNFVEYSPVTSFDASSATVDNLESNSAFYLSNGTGFSLSGATLAGWSDKPVYDPAAANFYELGGEYAVDTAEPVRLYAVWEVKAYFHLNFAAAGWGGTWNPETYTYDAGEDCYYRSVYRGSAMPSPENTPEYSGSEDLMFYSWRTAAHAAGTAPDDDDIFTFSAPVMSDIHLYAYWAAKARVPFHAVDSSASVTVDRDGAWLPSVAEISVDKNGAQLSDPGDAEVYLKNGTAPEGYEFAFAAAHDSSAGIQTISESESITLVYYNTAKRNVYVRYADPDREDEELSAGTEIYFVYYRKKTVAIGYMHMSTDGTLTSLTGDAVSAGAPEYSQALGSGNMASAVTAPMSYNASAAYYAYAVGGTGAANASELEIITNPSNTDLSRPELYVRGTWCGFEYSTDGSAWMNCGYDMGLYVLYFDNQPRIITIREATVGTKSVADELFDYRVTITDYLNGAAGGSRTILFDLSDGEAKTISAYGWTDGEGTHTQEVTVEQTVKPLFDVENTSDAGNGAAPDTWIFSTEDAGDNPAVTFTNRHRSLEIEVHVALVENGGIVLRDDLRSSVPSDYRFDALLDESYDFVTVLDPSNVFTGDEDVYAFGSVLLGSDDGSLIIVDVMGLSSVSYGAVSGNIRELLLKGENGENAGEAGDGKIYYLFYDMPRVKYVKEEKDGTFTPVKGSADGLSVSNSITYGRNSVVMNSETVVPDQSIEIPLTGFVLSQEPGSSNFHMPPILDDGTFERYLIYDKIGIGNSSASCIGDLGEDVSDGLTAYINIRDNLPEYSFDGSSWKVLGFTPTIYAVYTERGYDLEITKTVDTSVSGTDAMFSSAVFTVTVTSPTITKTTYKAEGAGISYVSAIPADGENPGRIVLEVKDGSTVKIIGVGRGEYTVTESDNDSYTLSAKTGPITGGPLSDVPVSSGSTLVLTIDKERKLELKNTPNPLCKVTYNDIEHVFYTINKALDFIQTNVPEQEASVEMLSDYTMSEEDRVEVFTGFSITFTTAADGVYRYAGSGKAVIKRGDDLTANPMFSNEGSLIFENITIDGMNVEADFPLIVSSGSLTVGKGSVARNGRNTGNGGAISASGSGNVNISGNVTGNTASSGGAVYYSGSGAVNLSGNASVSGNRASGGNGGAIYAASGTVDLSGTADVSGNSAAGGNGGGIYAENAIIDMEHNSAVYGNTASSGGGIYAESGELAIRDSARISGNTAQTGNGGGICVISGTVGIFGGTLALNYASSGNGGAVYTDTGSVQITGGDITGNTAPGGAAVFINSGTGSFTDCGITGNITTGRGAVAVGTTAAKLTFSGNTVITGNIFGEGESNVYLGLDSDAIINAVGLGSGAEIGVYVEGDFEDALFKNRGAACARFGTFTVANNLTAFVNDRLPSLKAIEEPNAKKILWGKSIEVEVRYLASYASGLPPVNGGAWKYSNTEYYPVSGECSASELADNMYSNYSAKLTATAVFGTAFAAGASGFDEYVVGIKWSSSDESWTFIKRDGTTVTGSKIIIYYAEPAFVTIENNTGLPLDISSLSVNGRNAVNTSSSAGYGIVFAKNGAIQKALLPINESDLMLSVGMSVKLLFPGGCNQTYVFAGSFDTDTGEPVRLRRTGKTEETLDANEVKNGFSLTDKTLNTPGANYDIIFGDDKYICKITDEHRFSSISAAVEYAASNGLENAVIGMLTDYLLPGSDRVEIPQGLKITLTTANDGVYRYNGGERAAISRDSENKNPFITSFCSGAATETSLTVSNLIFDGKSIRGNSDGGAINTKNCKVTASGCEFSNFIAGNGGAIYVEFVNFGTLDTTDNTLTLSDCDFTNCVSDSHTLRQGGGAIWTNAINFTVSGSDFESCSAYDQGGAVFHRIDWNYAAAYRRNSRAEFDGCSFVNCSARAAGGIEIDAYYTAMRNCSFNNCQATARNGGGMNMYIQPENDSMTGVAEETYLFAENCRFSDCLSTSNGGALRSTARHNSVKKCTFENSTAAQNGGGLAMTDVYATDAEVLGCTFSGCSAGQKGGGVYCTALVMNVGSFTDGEGTEHDTTATNCSAQRGGGICHDRNAEGSSLNVGNLTVSSCTADNGPGGGVYTIAWTVAMTDTVVSGCTAKSNGGGICAEKSVASRMTLSGCTVSGNTAGGIGGGVYTGMNLALQNTSVTGNRLSTGNAGDAAGLYMLNNRTLIIGTEGASEDTSSVKDNRTASGGSSNLRLWEGGGANNAASISVLCNLSGKFFVINAKNAGTQFGSSAIAKPNGFSDNDRAFQADDGTLWGIISRTDSSGKKIIWGGPPACKITDGNGTLLYMKSNGTDPAIFDRLDNGGTGADETGAFALLKTARNNLKLYYEDGTLYSGDTFAVKMLVEEYTSPVYITTNKNNGSWMKIIFTTASKSDTDGYPYRGRTGTHCTVTKGGNFENLLTAKVNITLRDITLDGGSQNGVSTAAQGGIMLMKDYDAVVVLGTGTILQNVSTTGNGGGICVNTGTLVIEGASFRNCSAKNGGAVYMNSGKPLTLVGGSIYQCAATENGGGICVNNTSLFTMSGGTIDRCTAGKNGGGVFVGNGKRMNMSGGFITANTASEKGGGIAAGNASSRLWFYEKPTVSGNKLGDEICNVQLDFDSNGVINSGTLYNGAYVGVYIPGTEGTNSLFDKHGVETMPFGTFENGTNTSTLYGFVNDRNGLKGGLKPNPAPNTIYWIKIFSLEVSKEVSYSESIPAVTVNGILNETFDFTVRLRGRSGDGTVFAKDIDGEYGGMIFESNGKDTSTAHITLKHGEKIMAENLPAGLDYEVSENLSTVQAGRYYSLPDTVRTGKIGENARPEVDEAEWYVSRVGFFNIRPVCKITDNNGNILYVRYDEGHNVPALFKDLSDAVTALDGALYSGASLTSPTYSGMNVYHIEMLVPDYTVQEAITVKSGFSVKITTASLSALSFPYQGSEGYAVLTRGFDGASMFTASGHLTLGSVTVDGAGNTCTVTADGGIVYVPAGGELTIETGALLRRSNTAGNGGAVYALGVVNMTGGSVTNNHCDGNGAGIYVGTGGVLRLSGSPDFGGKGTDSFGNINPLTGNTKNGNLIAKTNGGQVYEAARQDIYIPETGEAPVSIILDGSLTGEEGSIWVWAEDQKHYAMLKPFASIKSGTVSKASYLVFRNARTDDITLCGEDGYLTGNSGANALYIYWTGGLDVLFKKTDGFGEALGGAAFSLYEDYGCSVPVYVTVDGARTAAFYSSAAFSVATDGTAYNVSFNAAPGVFYMKETSTPSGYTANTYVYRVICGKSAAESVGEMIPGTSEFLIQRLTAGAASPTPDPAGPDVGKYGVLNESTAKRRLIFKKTDGSYAPLTGAMFDVLRCDMTAVGSGCVSGEAGVFMIEYFPYGTYYIHETVVPDGFAKLPSGDNWYSVTLDKDGIGKPLRLPSAP